MDFRSLTAKEFIEDYGGKELMQEYTPVLLKFPLKLFYKKTCGDIFDLVLKKGHVTPEAAKALQDAFEAKYPN